MSLGGKFGEESEADKEAKAQLRNLLANPETAKGGPHRFSLEDMLPHLPGGTESDTVNTASWCEDEAGNKVHGIYRGRSLLEMSAPELRELVVKLAEELDHAEDASMERADAYEMRDENDE